MTEQQIIDGLKRHDVKAFKKLISVYSPQMVLLAYLLTHDARKAGEISDSILLELYRFPSRLDENCGHLERYLIAEVRAACLIHCLMNTA